MSAKGHDRLDASDIRRTCSLLSLVPQDPPPRRTNAHRWIARCPFHEDGRPSMSVSFTEFGWVYRCFACGEHGDVIRFVMLTERVSFRDALRKLDGGGVRAAVPLWLPPKRPEVVFPCQQSGCQRVLRLPLVDLWCADLRHPSWDWEGEHVDRKGWCAEHRRIA